MDSSNLPSHCFEVEITESVMAENPKKTAAILGDLKKMGMSISVDDFGTGYSSLLYLKNFPINSIKIDRFFVKDILNSRQDTAIVNAIIVMAKSLKMTTIAEGIETREQFRILREMGCDIGQGYFFSPPIPEDALAKLLQENVSLVNR